MERSGSDQQLELPGFRFHPTEEELLEFYLRRMVQGKRLNFDIIGTINLYRYDPCDLPRLAKIGEREWYFFVPRDRRQSSGGRPNRTTERGFWKATGSDRPIRSSADPKRLLGLKKTLVFYEGRAPRGSKTHWVMNEYRLPDAPSNAHAIPPPGEDIVLCKVYRKATSLKELEQRAAVEEQARAMQASSSGAVSVADTVSSSEHDHYFQNSVDFHGVGPSYHEFTVSTEEAIVRGKEEEVKRETEMVSSSTLVAAGAPAVNLPQLQVPPRQLGMEWAQDSLWAQLKSPWKDPWSPLANLLNF